MKTFTLYDDLNMNMEDEDDNYLYMEDILYNLSRIKNDDELFIIASMGLWNGRFSGYALYTGTSISTAVERCFGNSYNILEVDENNDLTITGVHHDGRNYMTIRAWKKGTTDTQKEKLKNKLYNQQEYEEDMKKYTKSIGGKVRKYFLG